MSRLRLINDDSLAMRNVQQLPPIEPRGNGLLRAVKRATFAFGLLALAMTSGCAAMAAPMALNVAKAVVSGISSSARTAKNNQVAQDQLARDTEPCDMGERPLPRLIELRTDNRGTTMYRPLNLGGSMVDPQAQQAVGQIGGLGAWRAMGDLAGMHFEPPLQSQLAPSSVIFLAYAPTQAHDPAEQSQLDALHHDFGPTSGIFDWDNRVFLYSAVHQLPCESSRRPAPTQASVGPTRPESPDMATRMGLDPAVGGKVGKPAQAEPERPEQPEQPRSVFR